MNTSLSENDVNKNVRFASGAGGLTPKQCSVTSPVHMQNTNPEEKDSEHKNTSKKFLKLQ